MANRIQLSLLIHVLNAKVLAELRAYAERMHRHLGGVIRQQMRLLLIDTMKLTPPFGSRAARRESWSAQRKIGEKAVTRDINRVFSPIDTLITTNRKLGPAIKSALQQNSVEVLGLQNSLPELLVKAKVMDQPDASKILDAPTREIHDRFRIRGRVRGRIPYKYFVKRASALKRFVRQELVTVGILKGGWMSGALRFKASAPVWISRHHSGDVVDQTNAKENPFAIARNTVPYIAANDADVRIVANALQDREKSMERQIKAYTDRLTKL
jgi:hypothetical protein